jgi:hypothetical protein
MALSADSILVQSIEVHGKPWKACFGLSQPWEKTKRVLALQIEGDGSSSHGVFLIASGPPYRAILFGSWRAGD